MDKTRVAGSGVDALEAADWYRQPLALFSGGNEVRWLRGGDALFPAMIEAIDAARETVWLATYIFHHDETARLMAHALAAAAARGVQVRVVVDGFGSKASLPSLRYWWTGQAVELAVFRRIDRWWAVLQPGQLRRLHQKLCVVDAKIAFVGGINIIDDRNDLNHGFGDVPRLDYAVSTRGPVVAPIEQTARAMWTRAALAPGWREEMLALARSAEPLNQVRGLLRRLRIVKPSRGSEETPSQPMLAAFVVRDNLRQRRAIERSYIDAIRGARRRIDLVCSYFYPGHQFLRTLRSAARRGVAVRLLVQGKLDYRIAGMAAQALYDDLLHHGVRVFEYTPAFLHAKVAIIDDEWATVGSSNIDPLSLLMNLEANVIVKDAAFAAQLAADLELAFAASAEVDPTSAQRKGFWRAVQRALVAWTAYVVVRAGGITGRY